MKEIKVTTQQEFDNLPKSFTEFTYIYLYGKFEVYFNWENSQVIARENSQVTAGGNSQVTAGEIAKLPQGETLKCWLENNGVEISSEKEVVLFKRVSKDFKTEEKTRNETVWTIGKELEITNFEPSKEECGIGKFHACSYPYFCDEFRNEKEDRYIAIEISIKDLYAWPEPQYPHKIAFRKGSVIFECDKYGKQLKSN